MAEHDVLQYLRGSALDLAFPSMASPQTRHLRSGFSVLGTFLPTARIPVIL